MLLPMLAHASLKAQCNSPSSSLPQPAAVFVLLCRLLIPTSQLCPRTTTSLPMSSVSKSLGPCTPPRLRFEDRSGRGGYSPSQKTLLTHPPWVVGVGTCGCGCGLASPNPPTHRKPTDTHVSVVSQTLLTQCVDVISTTT